LNWHNEPVSIYDAEVQSQEESRRERLTRAYQSLEGLSVGDAFGERFFVPNDLALSLIAQKAVPASPWIFTDDTMMAISIVSTLEEHAEIDEDHLARSFARNYDPSRGYGPAMHQLLGTIRQGGHWRSEAKALFGGQGSFGNGSAMRVAPLGAYFADDLDKVVEQAERSAVTTHCHAEAVAGAIAVALAAALAWQHGNSSQLPSTGEFLQQIHQRTPPSEVRNGIQKAIDFPEGTTVQVAASALGNGSMVTAQDTVPFAVWSAAGHLTDYQEALWATVSGLGDRDTTCAMVGGIVVMYTGAESIPREWLNCREPIPRHMLKNYEMLSSPDHS
jgi:ADP-ribosylglycohydrolase